MIQVLQRARETREPLNPSLLKSGFNVVGVLWVGVCVYARVYVGVRVRVCLSSIRFLLFAFHRLRIILFV